MNFKADWNSVSYLCTCIPAETGCRPMPTLVGTCSGCGAPARFSVPCEYCGGLHRDQATTPGEKGAPTA